MPDLHKHLLVDAKLNKPPTDAKVVEDWLRRLVKAVDMEIFMEPQAKFCDDPNNEGVTGTVVITTSHASVHVWSGIPEPYAKFDLYSCKDFTTADFLKLVEEFEPTKVSYTVIDRTGDVHRIVDQDVLLYKR